MKTSKPISAGFLVWRRHGGQPQVLLGHLGGPYWQHKDDGAWTLFKGLTEPGDKDLLHTALREFAEETGWHIPPGTQVTDLGAWPTANKINRILAVQMDPPLSTFRSNRFEMEWPPHSGREQSFPEIDRVAWFDAGTARRKLVKSLRPVLERWLALVSGKH